MNVLIKKELDKVKVANVQESGNTIYVKGTKLLNQIQFEKNKYYRIELKDYLVHPYEGFNLHIQWNNNIAPKDCIMNIEVIDTMGKMIKVTGCGESGIVWTGWLPISSVSILDLL